MRSVFFILATMAIVGGCLQVEDVASLRPELEQSSVSRTTVSSALVEVPSLSAIALLGQAGQNGPVITFSSSDRKTISLQRGVLVRTAGFGHDLFYSDPHPTLAAIAAKSEKSYRRTYSFLTETDRITSVTVSCSMQFAGIESTTVMGQQRSLSKSLETCSGKDVSFENEYWSDSSGALQKSKEMVSPDLGYAIIDTASR